MSDYLNCRQCGQPVEQFPNRRSKLYCNANCKKRYQRLRKKKLASVNRDTIAPNRDIITVKHHNITAIPKSMDCPACNKAVNSVDGVDYWSKQAGRKFTCACHWNSFISANDGNYFLLDWSKENER